MLLGNILLVGVVSGVPMFAKASLQRLLMQQTQRQLQETSVYPGLVAYRAQVAPSASGSAVENIEARRRMMFEELPQQFGLPVLITREQIVLDNIPIRPEKALKDEEPPYGYQLIAATDLAEHAEIVKGRMYNDTPGADGVIEVIVSERTYDRRIILLDTVYESVPSKEDQPVYRFRVVGVFTNSQEADLYWAVSPTRIYNAFFMPEGIMYATFVDVEKPPATLYARWEVNLDCGALDLRHAAAYQAAAERYRENLNASHASPFTEGLTQILSGYNEKAQKLDITLWVLQTPVFIMLAFFIYMVSGQILSLDQSDISVLKSRGATRGQIVRLYAFQGLFVGVVSAALGLLLGRFICLVIGSANGFLEFVGRAGLDARIDAAAVLYAVGAAVLSMLMMIGPVIRYSKVDIVGLKHNANQPRKMLWQKLFLDVAALGVALYGLYSFYLKRDILAAAPEALGAVDPLMFLTSSLFMIGLGLLCLRLFPVLIGLIFRIVRKVASPSLYASLLSVRRGGGGERFIMIFLIFTLASGIFNARAATTINRNMSDRIHYAAAVDIRLTEVWLNNSVVDDSGFSSPPTIYYEPDFSKYALMPEVDTATKVLSERGSITGPSLRLSNVQVMGIQTDGFGRAVWYRNDLLPIHINHYLNALALDPRGVIVSGNFRAYYKIGDYIDYRTDKGNASGVIYGFADYWPGYVPMQRVGYSDGGYEEHERFLIVANLSYLQSLWGVTPYEVWLQTNTDSGRFLTEYANEHNIRFTAYTDVMEELVRSKNDPVLQGTNGALTVNFIITLVVCAAGFLIYWILSMKSRALQFGVFRAMGLSMRGILAILVHEQILVSGTAIVLGVAIGEITSRLFVPIIQVAYTASESLIPLHMAAEALDYGRLALFVGVMMAVCISALGIISSRIRIAAALKLGED